MTFVRALMRLVKHRSLLPAPAGYGRVVRDDDEHLRLEQAFRQCAGMWVAIDRQTGVVRAAAATPYVLAAKLKSERIANVDVIRAPAVDEPEVVGFG